MKLILELDKNDIDYVFIESYEDNQIHLHQLEKFHFKDDAQAYWKEADEVWYYRKAYIGDTEKIKLK